jgi:hypothetical protein
MPVIIIMFLIGIAVLFYLFFIMKTPENELIRQFYKQTYGIEVRKETVLDMKYGVRNNFIDWLIEKPGMNCVYLEKRLLKKSMNALEKHARDLKYESFEQLFKEQK